MLALALEDLRAGLRFVFQDQELSATFSWPVESRTVSEIGGRLIEDFVLSRIDVSLKSLGNNRSKSIGVEIPSTGRSLEDFRVRWLHGGDEITLLVDVKGHNELRPGSRPNLASIRKCAELYNDPRRQNSEVVIFFCRYRPNVPPGEKGQRLSYNVLPESFGDEGVFLLRHLSLSNLDPANIGSGGQLLLARHDRIRLELRTRRQFADLLGEFQRRLSKQRPAATGV